VVDVQVNCGVYRWLNTINGKSYVGSSRNLQKRKSEHLRFLHSHRHHSIKLQRAWDKYGSNAFEFQILKSCLKENLLEHEQVTINALDAVSNGYNVALTAESPMYNRRHSQAAKDKMSAAHKGRSFSSEHKRKLGLAAFGRTIKVSDEGEKRRRANIKALWTSSEFRNKQSKARCQAWDNDEKRKETASVRSYLKNHQRWHTSRGLVNSECRHCQLGE
jgi:group I intron endonuclease